MSILPILVETGSYSAPLCDLTRQVLVRYFSSHADPECRKYEYPTVGYKWAVAQLPPLLLSSEHFIGGRHYQSSVKFKPAKLAMARGQGSGILPLTPVLSGST